jgi:hypothetical protein
VVNNLFIGTGSNAAFVCDSSARTSDLGLSHNDIFNAVGSVYATDCGPANGGGLAVDPLFVSAGTGDFHLQVNSPVMAQGDITAPGLPATDLDGNPRISNGTINPGVYEFGDKIATVNTLASSLNPANVGQTITFTSTVSGAGGTPTGLVTFLDGPNILGSAALTGSGVAQFATGTLTPGSHSITANYGGDSVFASSLSNVVSESIVGLPVTFSLSVSPNPGYAFHPITLSAMVTSSNGTPSGSVAFFSGTNQLGQATLSASGQAGLTTTALGPGVFALTATYSGNSTFSPSTSNTVTETVTPIGTSSPEFNLSVIPATLTLKTQDRGVLSVTVTGSGGISDAVKLSCANLPPNTACGFSTPSLSVTSGGVANSTLTIKTGVFTTVASLPRASGAPHGWEIGIVLACIFPACILSRRHTLKSIRRALLLLLAGAAIAGLGGCGSIILSAPTPPGNYILEVAASGSSSGINHAVSISLIVTP